MSISLCVVTLVLHSILDVKIFVVTKSYYRSFYCSASHSDHVPHIQHFIVMLLLVTMFLNSSFYCSASHSEHVSHSQHFIVRRLVLIMFLTVSYLFYDLKTTTPFVIITEAL